MHDWSHQRRWWQGIFEEIMTKNFPILNSQAQDAHRTLSKRNIKETTRQLIKDRIIKTAIRGKLY